MERLIAVLVPTRTNARHSVSGEARKGAPIAAVHNRRHFLSLNISCMSLAGVTAAIPRFTYSRRGKSADASGGISSQCDRMMPTR